MRTTLINTKVLLRVVVLLLALQAHGDTLLGKVIHVADGDTIIALDATHSQHKIRLAGIDAPESKQTFGNVSKRSLVEQVAGQAVAVEWSKTDKYQRKIGKVLLDGLDTNLEQIRLGLALQAVSAGEDPHSED
jgi:endonuclease YncB( thermonuclease family)